LGVALAVAACAEYASGAGPYVDGPLRPRISYPGEQTALPHRDTTLVYGSLGSGRASLTINGVRVRVHPNGSFLSRIPVPAADGAFLRLVAVLKGDTAVLVQRVRLETDRSRTAEDAVAITPSSLELIRNAIVRAGDLVPLEVSTKRGARTWVESSFGRWLLPHTLKSRHGALIPAEALAAGATLVAVRGDDTTRRPLPRVTLAGESARRVTVGGKSVGAHAGMAPGATRLGAEPSALLPAGFRGVMTGRIGGSVRIEARGAAEWWVDSAFVSMDAHGPHIRVSQALEMLPPSVLARARWLEVRVPLAEPLPFTVREQRRGVVLIVHGARTPAPRAEQMPLGSYVSRIHIGQRGPDQVEIRADLATAAHGYMVRWDGTHLVLRIRQPPRVHPTHPLRGRVIALDAGHPPGGTVGPTGLHESNVTLDVARRAAALIRERGGAVVLTRSDERPVSLGKRVEAGEAANADALVSIHLDARIDSRDLYADNGSRAFYLRAQAWPLADALQRAVSRTLRLPPKGVFRQDLALTTPTWMPAVLCEGTMLVLPEEEAKLRTPGYRQEYARGIADGVENYFRTLGNQAAGEWPR
jgi:N-acetylmuramoyl-L-alanine amidase